MFAGGGGGLVGVKYWIEIASEYVNRSLFRRRKGLHWLLSWFLFSAQGAKLNFKRQHFAYSSLVGTNNRYWRGHGLGHSNVHVWSWTWTWTWTWKRTRIQTWTWTYCKENFRNWISAFSGRTPYGFGKQNKKLMSRLRPYQNKRPWYNFRLTG